METAAIHSPKIFISTPTIAYSPANNYSIADIDEFHKSIIEINNKILKKVLKLKHGWDGESAEEFDKEFIRKIARTIELAKYPPKIFIGEEGNLILEYYQSDERQTTINVDSSTISICHQLGDKINELEYPFHNFDEVLNTYGTRQFARARK